MANDFQVLEPRKLNMDASPKKLGEDEAYYILNNQTAVNPNGANNGAALGKSTPLPANKAAFEMDEVPLGENYAPHAFESKLTNESYSWVMNSNGAHYIQRINGNGEGEIVYAGECLELSADPKHQIIQQRAYMRLEKKCANRDGKYLLWTTGQGAIGHIDTEASIATNFFTTPFFNICRDDCAFIQLCVPEICGCISGEFVVLPVAERSLTNHLVDVPIQIAIRHITYDNRASEWSEWSKTFFQDSRSCFDGDAGFSRCLKLRIPIGNPTVSKIEVAFSKDGGASWALYDTIEKYKKYNSAQEKWYERQLSEQVSSTFDEEDCSFDYFFCNDKQCQPIDQKEFTRVRNPIPRNAQGFLEIKDALGVYNYEDGVCPIDKTETEKMKISVQCDDKSCVPELVTVTVRAVIHNVQLNRNQFIWRALGSGNDADTPSDPAFWGGVDLIQNIQDVALVTTSFNQQFRGDARNFFVYIDGTGYSAAMKQKLNTRNVANATEVGTLNNADDNPTLVNYAYNAMNQGYFQEIKLRVPKGTKGFLRLSSHLSTFADEDTSAQIVGTINDIALYREGDIQQMGFNQFKREIYIDTCQGTDIDLKETFVISDLAVGPKTSANSANAYSGYIRDALGVGITGAEIWANGNRHGNILRARTDHNGFYSFNVYNEEIDNGSIRVERDCAAFSHIETFFAFNANYHMTVKDYEIKQLDYNSNHYTNVNVSVKDCDGLAVGGMRVSMSEGKYAITGADGIARFKLRNISTRNRSIRAVLINLNGCITKDCNGKCSPCMPDRTATTPTCYTNTTITLGNMTINRNSTLTRAGLKSGGRYPFGFVVKGNCGRTSAVNEVSYINIPKTQDKGYLSFCSFSYDARNIVLPEWADCVSIVRGENLNPFELQWVIDKIQKTEGKLKLTIQSLNNYNEKHLFKTNTGYQWLKGDRIEFIANGDGAIFTTAQHGSLNYLTLSPFNDELESGSTDSPADFFNQLLILDDGRLNNLKVGAIIEIQRAKQCSTEPVYREICVSIPLISNDRGGKVFQYPQGTFTTFDTFMVNRIITGLPVLAFEHHSPSDFWGERVSDAGRAHFLNPYENEQRFGRNLSLNSPTQYNYFGDLVKRFDAPGQGDIIAMDIKDGRIILAICEHDNFTAEASDDLVRVGSDGTIRALPADAIVSEGQPKISGTFGCQYPHIGSILFGDGWAVFWDVNKHSRIIHNYQYAKVAGERPTEKGNEMYSQCNTYVQKRSQEIETFNRTKTDFYDHLRFSSGYNKSTGDVYCTIKALRQSGINNEMAPYLKPNETIAYNPVTDNYKGFVSFTAEGYSSVNLFDGGGCSFLSYLNAIPYIHPVVSSKFNEFYGVACDWMFGVVLNKNQNIVKRAFSVEIQSQTMFYVKDVRTEMANYRSEIPPIKMVRSEDKWNGAFLGNANSREGLHSSTEPPRGYYVKALFIRDNTDQLKYNTVDNTKRTIYSELDNILIKFVDSAPVYEQNL